MNCPNCRRPLKQVDQHGETVDRCSQCNGVWYDEHELREVLKCIKTPTEAKKKIVEYSTVGRICPRCDVAMLATNYAYDSGIKISRCQKCCGVWLDWGQLGAIAIYRRGTPAINNLVSAQGEHIRSENRRRFFRNALRSKSASGTVAAGYIANALFFGGMEAAVYWVIFLVHPLAAIWFCDVLGNLSVLSLGLAKPFVTQKAPGECVAFGGWVLLLCPLVIYVFLWTMTD